MRVAITGANGFIGQALLRRLGKSGVRLIALTRKPLPEPVGIGVDWIEYTLERGLSARLPKDCDAVIHCAYAISPRGAGDVELNVNAFNALRTAAMRRQFVFLSSMSAHTGARSAYGRGKWAIEGLVRDQGDLAIKPGLVIGSGGVFDRLRRSIRSLPFVPVFYGGHQPIQTIWVEDLAEGVTRALERRIRGTLALGSIEATTMRGLYGAIMANDNIRRPLVPVPGGLSLVMLRLFERLGIGLPVSSENLLGLSALRLFETKSSFELLEFQPIEMDEALRRTDAIK
jgi:nucleoside-diphosphate-sugar epimerase